MTKTHCYLLMFSSLSLFTNCSLETEGARDVVKTTDTEYHPEIRSMNDSLQIITKKEIEYLKSNPDAWLTEIVDSTFEFKDQHIFDSLILYSTSKFLSNDFEKKEVPFEFGDKWILFSCSNLSLKGCDPDNLEGRKSYSIVQMNKNVFSGRNVYELFNLNEQQKPLNNVPVGVGRTEQWIPILTNDSTLLIQYLHSYPDGGKTCFYHEKIYRFNKQMN